MFVYISYIGNVKNTGVKQTFILSCDGLRKLRFKKKKKKLIFQTQILQEHTVCE